MIASVHAGAISKNASHAGFHWPAAFILSQTGVAAAFGVGFTPIAFASSNRMGAPRLHVWIDRSDADLQDHQDLVAAGAGFECAANMPAGSLGAQGRTRSIHRQADQLDVFAWQHAAGPRISGHLEALLDPLRVPFTKLRQRRVVPRTGGSVCALPPHSRPEPGPRPVPQRQVCPAVLRCLSRIADGSLPFAVSFRGESHLFVSFSLSWLASSS